MHMLTNEQRAIIQKEIATLLREKFSLQQSVSQEREKSKASMEELLLELLELYDALDFIINYMEENAELSPQFIKRLPKSLDGIKKKLLTILERREVKPIDLQDDKPDYAICQVVDNEIRDDVPEKTITKIVRQGFTTQDKVLRPVEVIIAKNSF